MYTISTMQYLLRNWAPFTIIFLGFFVSLCLALAPIQFLLSNYLVDDAFYYFQIARNITHGLGSTFDGINPTNGYHPLWMLLLLPIFAHFSTPVVMDIAPIHATLALAAVCTALLGIVLLLIISRYTSGMWIKALALASWFFNPYNIYGSLDGLETALSLLCIAVFILVALRYKERSTYEQLVIVGLVAGVMMLARLDDLFYFVMFLAWLVYDRGLYRSIRPILFVGIIATLVVSPWLIFNYLDRKSVV